MQGAIRRSNAATAKRTTKVLREERGSRRFLRYVSAIARRKSRWRCLHRIARHATVVLWVIRNWRRHYGRASSFCGSSGVKFETALIKAAKAQAFGRRNGYRDASLQPKYDFEKSLYSLPCLGAPHNIQIAPG